MSKKIRKVIGAVGIAGFLVWDFWDGFKGGHSIFLGFCYLIGGIISFLVLLAILEAIYGKKNDDAGPTVV